MQSKILVFAALSVFFSSFGVETSASPPARIAKPHLHYKLTLLNFWAQAINDHGVICGCLTVGKRDPKTHQLLYEDGHLVMWKQGKLRDLGHLPNTDVCIAAAINSRSEIVGSMSEKGLAHGDSPPNSSHIFLWSQGHLHDLGVEGQANAINNMGQIVGQRTWSHGKYGYQLGFLYTNGRMVEITGTPAWQNSTVNSINNKGQMLGVAYSPKTEVSSVFLSQKGHVVEISSPGQYGVDAQHCPALNDFGQVMFNAERHVADPANPYPVDHCYLYQSKKVRDIGLLPGFIDMNGVAINNHAEIVGNAVVSGTHYKSRPFLWGNDVLYNLNNLVLHPGWTMTSASGINNRGQIIGQGQGNGKEYNFLLTPITQ